MVTVEADVVRVEFRLAVGGIGCPTCRDGVLDGWGMPGPGRSRGSAIRCGRSGRAAGRARSPMCCCR
jgi:hypothetical protein